MTTDSILTMNADTLRQTATILEVFEEETELQRQSLINALIARAKDLKIKTEVEGLINAAKKDIAARMKDKAPQDLKEVKAGVTDFADGELTEQLNCGRFYADNNGIWKYDALGREIMACYNPIYPARILKNIDTGAEKVVLRYSSYDADKGKDEWLERCVDKSVMVNHKQIVKLADYGILVNSVSAKSLVEYLSVVEAKNPIPISKSTSKFGWTRSGEFIPYSKDVLIENQGPASRISGAIKEVGDIDKWLALFKKVITNNKNHFEPQFLVAASLASVLLGPLHLQPFVVNIWGVTGKGKSLTLMLAASVWADPTGNKFITEADNTRNALVKKCGTLNHLPLCIDDFSKVTRKLSDSEDIIYSLCSGSEKERLDRESDFKTSVSWQNVTLTTNESPLVKEYMRGGAINRVLDIAMRDDDVFSDPAEVVNTLSENYGGLGPLFLDYLQIVGFEEIRQRQQDIRADLEKLSRQQGSVKENKQLLPLSVILTADYYLVKWLKTYNTEALNFNDITSLPKDYLLSQLKGTDQVSDGQRAYEDVLGYVSANPHKFVDMVKNPSGENFMETWGYIKEGHVFFNNFKFKEFMKNNNYDITAFCNWAKSQNPQLIKCNNRNQYRLRVGDELVSCYGIKLPIQKKQFEADSEHEAPWNE